jgi:hypothetical protein
MFYGNGNSMFIINPFAFGGVAFDADALAFITAASITDTTQKNAINQLVLDLKANNIWTKMIAVYPFVGGSASQHKFNLIDPRDLDAAYRLSFAGGWTHSYNGALPNGTTAYSNTFFIPIDQLGTTPLHMSYYSRSNTNTGTDQIDIGCSQQPTQIHLLSAWYNASGYSNVVARNSSNLTLLDGGATTDSRGFYQVNKVGTTSKLQRNANILDSETDNGTNAALYPIYIGAWNNSGATNFYSNRECAFASIGAGLSDTEASNLYTAVQTFQTTLSRQV